MAGVRGAIQQLRSQQDTIQANIEKIDDEIREAKNENDKVGISIIFSYHHIQKVGTDQTLSQTSGDSPPAKD